MTASPGTIVDFSAHIYPESVFPDPEWDDVAKMKNYVREVIGPVLTDPDAFEALYTEAGIDIAVLSMPYYMGHDDSEMTAHANDELLKLVGGYEMFRGLASVPVAAGGEAAAAEYERCLENGFHGGALETRSEGIELIDDVLQPVFEVADRTGAPILVHPKLKASLGPDVLDDNYRLNAIFGREAALSESLSKVIHEGVLDRYPDLNLVYHHLGGNIASMLGRINLELTEGRMADLSGIKNSEEFMRQLESRIYVDTSGFFNHALPLRAALEKFPSTQVLFGTDATFEHRTPKELRTGPELISDIASRTEADLVLDGNATRLLYED